MRAAISAKRNLGEGPPTLFDAMEREDRRRQPQFLFSASMTVRLKDGISMPGISVDMSAGGPSAMVSGVLTEGDTAQPEPVAGGPASAKVRHKVGGCVDSNSRTRRASKPHEFSRPAGDLDGSGAPPKALEGLSFSLRAVLIGPCFDYKE